MPFLLPYQIFPDLFFLLVLQPNKLALAKRWCFSSSCVTIFISFHRLLDPALCSDSLSAALRSAENYRLLVPIIIDSFSARTASDSLINSSQKIHTSCLFSNYDPILSIQKQNTIRYTIKSLWTWERCIALLVFFFRFTFCHAGFSHAKHMNLLQTRKTPLTGASAFQ